MSKPSICRMGLGFLLLYGLIPALIGYFIVRQWAAERTVLAVCAATLLLSGATMLMSALWLLSDLGNQRLPVWTGSIGSILSGGMLVGATLTNVLPCSGPN